MSARIQIVFEILNLTTTSPFVPLTGEFLQIDGMSMSIVLLNKSCDITINKIRRRLQGIQFYIHLLPTNIQVQHVLRQKRASRYA